MGFKIIINLRYYTLRMVESSISPDHPRMCWDGNRDETGTRIRIRKIRMFSGSGSGTGSGWKICEDPYPDPDPDENFSNFTFEN